ncbi:MAG: hypothetical protein R3313_05035 [Candidatus Saccharimonadales bacterium]|nr:hypothetical protein [Candidatus Saccharimonadales bacterium]
MTEQALYDPGPETVPQPLHAPAERFFASSEEITAAVVDAVDSGLFKIELTDDLADKHKLPVFARIPIGVDDIAQDSIALRPENSRRETFSPQEVVLIEPDEIGRREAAVVRKHILSQAEDKYSRFYNEPSLKEKIISGTEVNQYAEVSIDGRSIPIVNFSQRLATAEELEDMRMAIETMSNLTGGRIMDETTAILIEDSSEFDEKTAGYTRGQSRVVHISTTCLDPPPEAEIPEPLTYGTDIEASQLHRTMLHELGHIVDLSGLQRGVTNYPFQKFSFDTAVGWENQTVSAEHSDQHSSVIDSSIKKKKVRTSAPVSSHVFEDGKYREVNTLEHFGNEIAAEQPVNWYGEETDMEDMAEAMIPYALTRGQTPRLRENAITNILNINSGGEYGPRQAKLEIYDEPPQKIGANIPAQRVDVKIAYDLER